jgi:hypothetical protein
VRRADNNRKPKNADPGNHTLFSAVSGLMMGSTSIYDKDGKFIGYETTESLADPVQPESNHTTEREEDSELALRYLVEMKKLELQKENSDKNRGLALFIFITILGLLIGYLLFR